MKFFALPLAAMMILNSAIGRYSKLPYPDPAKIRIPTPDVVQSGTLLSLGMRRLAADLALIQLLIYYGTNQSGEADDTSVDIPKSATDYPGIGRRTLQIMDLDPFFSYAALYGAGALAFNLNRPEEALDILQTASRRDPKEWQYRFYIAAIGAKQKGNSPAVIDALTPALAAPDCPTMIKHVLAFLNRRLGRREEAIRIYRDMLDSRDSGYVQIARDALRQMGALPGRAH